jgi:hypothetical protein
VRRRTPLKPSRGTVWPDDVREHVREHQRGCIGPLAGMLGHCSPGTELDHIRASHGVGMKSESVASNAAQLCAWHHDMKTREGRRWRPVLLDVNRWLAGDCASCRAEREPEHPHVEFAFGCPECFAIRARLC